MSQTTTPITVSQNINHNKSTLAFLIVIFLILLGTLVIVAILLVQSIKAQRYFSRDSIRIIPGIWKIFQTDELCNIYSIISNCASPNHSTPYGRCLFPTLGDNPWNFSTGTSIQQESIVIGAHNLNYGEAVVVFGVIPRNKVYWAWTGYLWTIPWQGTNNRDGRLVIAGTIGDSIDAGNTFSRYENDYLAIVYTPNPNFVDVVKENFLSRVIPNSNFSIQWKSLLIPTSMYDASYDYCLFSRVLQTDEDKSIPPWQCWFFQATTTDVYKQPSLPVLNPIKIRSTLPNEYEIKTILDEPNINLWYEEGENFIKEITKNIQLPENWNLYARQTVPYYSWNPSICPDPTGPNCGLICGCQGLQSKINLRFDNNSTIYYANKEIKVLPKQMMVVYCLDHVASTAVVAYSNITFTDIEKNETSWEAHISGIVDPTTGPPTVPEKKIRVFYDLLDKDQRNGLGIATVIVTERAYLNKSGTGPWYSALLPCQIFLLPIGTPLPSFASNQGYPYQV